jgi:Protein of unknown function (DUF4089)
MTPEQQAAYVDAAAALAGLPIAPYRDGVLSYFALAASFADVVAAFPLAPHDESAETFIPVSPTVAP